MEYIVYLWLTKSRHLPKYKAPQNTGDIVNMLVVPMDPKGHVED